MAQFYSIDVNPSTEEIEKSVRENGGFIRSFGYGFATPGVSSERVGDWQIILTDKRGMGNHGSFIAVATTPETLKLQKQATMRLLRDQADAMEVRAALAEDEDLPYPGGPSEDRNDYFGYENHLELSARSNFRERGDFACRVVPLLSSPVFERKGCFLFADDKWAYFAYSHENYLRVGDGRHRLWVRSARKRNKK